MKKLKYALGEIIIVIIGITLAFMLNNWKDYRVNHAKAQDYLTHIKSDVERESAQLEATMLQLQQNNLKIDSLLAFEEEQSAHALQYLPLLFKVAEAPDFQPENTTYQTLINSGDLSLIADLDLRRDLEKHYKQHQSILKAFERIEKIHEKYLGDYFIHEINYAQVREEAPGFLASPLLKNILRSMKGANQLALRASKTCLESNKSLLLSIDIL